MGKIAALVVTCGLLLTAISADADEQMQTIAVSGDWVAASHRPNTVAQPDICLLYDAARSDRGVFYLRAAKDGFEIRIWNKIWSLPSHVLGIISISMGKYSDAWWITSNTNDMVMAGVPSEDLINLLSIMDIADHVLIKVGKAAPYSLSLRGVQRASNAFRVCGQLPGYAPDGGVNPFQ